MKLLKGFHTLVEHFRKQGWHHETNEERDILCAHFALQNGECRCMAAVNENDDLLQVFMIFPVVVPPQKRGAVAELCLRTSCELKLGNFDLDFNDGELRFRISVLYPKGELSDDVIQFVMDTILLMTDVHFQAFMTVIYGARSPHEVLRQVEQAMARVPEQQSEQETQPPSRIAFN